VADYMYNVSVSHNRKTYIQCMCGLILTMYMYTLGAIQCNHYNLGKNVL